MGLKHKRKEFYGLVGVLGCVAALGGFVGGYYSVATTIVLTFAVFGVGAMLVQIFTDP